MSLSIPTFKLLKDILVSEAYVLEILPPVCVTNDEIIEYLIKWNASYPTLHFDLLLRTVIILAAVCRNDFINCCTY